MRRVGALAAGLVLVMVVPTPALAHGRIVASDPSAGSRVQTAPDELRVWISETVAPGFSGVELTTLDGRPVAVDGVQVTTDEGQGLLIVDLPDLQDGTYSAEWTVLSESDGHVTRGLVVFGIGAVGADVGAFDLPAEDLPLPEGAAKFLSLLAVLWLTGAAFVSFFLLDRHENRSTRTIRRVMVLGTGVGMVSGVVLLLLQASDTSAAAGQAGLAGTAARLALTTAWGRFLLARELLFLVVLLWARRPRRSQIVLLSASAGLLAAQSLSSHAAGVAGQRALALTVDVAHLAAASVWVGGLATLFAIHRSGVTVPWERFGRTAALSVTVLVATGLYAGGLHVDSLQAAASTTYGRTLGVKLALFLAVGAFGAVNATAVHPAVRRAVGRRRHLLPTTVRLGRRVGWEVALGIAVVAATGLLTSLSPAIGPDRAAGGGVDAMSEIVDDMVVTLTATPNLPGDNVLVVYAASTVRPAIASIDRVLVRIARPADGIDRVTEQMEEVEPGRFRLGGSELARPGAWVIDVVVRRRGLPDVVATFDWTVSTPGSAGAPSLDDPLEPVTATAAVMLLLGLAAVVLWQVWRPEGHPPEPHPYRAEPELDTDEHPHDRTVERIGA